MADPTREEKVRGLVEAWDAQWGSLSTVARADLIARILAFVEEETAELEAKATEYGHKWVSACDRALDRERERDAATAEVARLRAALARIRLVTGTSTEAWHMADEALADGTARPSTTGESNG